MLVTPSGIAAEIRLSQPSNALTPILLTVLGIVTEARLLQYLNASSPMLVTPSGMYIEVTLLFHMNAWPPIALQLLFILTDSALYGPSINTKCSFPTIFIYLQPFSIVYSGE